MLCILQISKAFEVKIEASLILRRVCGIFINSVIVFIMYTFIVS